MTEVSRFYFSSSRVLRVPVLKCQPQLLNNHAIRMKTKALIPSVCTVLWFVFITRVPVTRPPYTHRNYQDRSQIHVLTLPGVGLKVCGEKINYPKLHNTARIREGGSYYSFLFLNI